MIALSYLSAIRFSDLDAGVFLHSQLSADVLGLASGESVFACYCEPKGRVLSLMLVCRFDECYYLIMASSLIQAIAGRLKIYVMRSKVKIEVLNDCLVSGMRADDKAEQAWTVLASIPLPASSDSLVLTTHENIPSTEESLQEAWRLSELQAGITWLAPETSGQFLPQMLGFDQLGAVNYRKGCYPGQEIVARTHYLGKVKRHPRLLNIKVRISPDPLEKLNIICSEKEDQAIIVDHVNGMETGTCLFAVTRLDPQLKAGTIEYRDQIIPLI